MIKYGGKELHNQNLKVIPKDNQLVYGASELEEKYHSADIQERR